MKFFRLLIPLLLVVLQLRAQTDTEGSPLWRKENLAAWCIVPFDAKQRTPEQRSEMVVRLGLNKVAYDWRDKHIPEFEDEILQYHNHNIEYFAFWGGHPKAYELFAKYKMHPQIWVIAPNPQAATNEEKVKLAAEGLLPVVEQTRKLGSKLAIYNHGSWSGEPENMVAIVEYLRKHHDGGQVGIVYNFHHGHGHILDFEKEWALMKPFVFAVNISGMEIDGEAKGRKILHLGEGDQELGMMRIIEKSGWLGPVGIIDHREETDSELTLGNNLQGLAWLRKELVKAGSGGPRPKAALPPRPPVKTGETVPGKFGKALDASGGGFLVDGRDDWRGAPITVEAWVKLKNAANFNVIVASDTKNSGEHWELYTHVGGGDFTVYLPGKGGDVRSGINICDDAWHHVAMLLAKDRIRLFVDGKMSAEKSLPARNKPAVPGDLAIGRTVESGIGCNGLIDDVRISRGVREIITVPTEALKKDATTFELFSLDVLPTVSTIPTMELEPLDPAKHPLCKHPVNRDRIYDFYAKQARDWKKEPGELLGAYPGLDGGAQGHWGNQNEDSWSDGRWNQMDCGNTLAGVFQGPGFVVPKAVCVKVGENAEFSACYDPETNAVCAVWQGGFLQFSSVRHGLMDSLRMKGELVDDPVAKGAPVKKPDAIYKGYYRHGKKTIFAHEVAGKEALKSLNLVDGKLVSEEGESLMALTKGGPAQWPQVLETKGIQGPPVPGWPYVIDTLTLPFENPWHSLFFVGGHDFFSNGDIALCTMTGDVWRVSGVDASLAKLRWKRMAAGLFQPLGLVVVDDKVCVMGRDQITRLHDLNGDGEADFYECLTNAFQTPTGGHDFICGLERDAKGNFYTAAGGKGLLRIKPGSPTEMVASGFRNPDGLGLSPDGVLTVPVSEGEWTPTSAIMQISEGGFYGYGGPKAGVKTMLPLLRLPRAMDNSSGGQTWVLDDRWGPLKGQMLHLSYGTGTHFLILRQLVDGLWQGAAVPLPGDFNSGVHRGRFSPHDGQLYVSGMTGWGTYTPDDGCLQRVRFTGGATQLPLAFEARDNGVLISFSEKLDASAANADQHFAQCWNYRYSSGYGSEEYLLSDPSQRGHDVLKITSAHIVGDGRQLFLEIPQLQPAGQIHLLMRPQPNVTREMFLTVHRLAKPFSDYAGYQVIAKQVLSGEADGEKETTSVTLKNPFIEGKAGRAIRVETAAGLQFATTKLTAKAGERLSLTLGNPDVLPHNWALLAPGSFEKVGDLANKIISDPNGPARHYVPDIPEVLAWTDMVAPGRDFTIHFDAPKHPGEYPYICTFPGHWMVMKGMLTVE